jgi:hypothetical protein
LERRQKTFASDSRCFHIDPRNDQQRSVACVTTLHAVQSRNAKALDLLITQNFRVPPRMGSRHPENKELQFASYRVPSLPSRKKLCAIVRLQRFFQECGSATLVRD